MQEISGILTMLGSGMDSKNGAGKSFVHYGTVEIGDRILQKVRTARSLGDFISRGLGKEVTLYLNGPLIIGVKLPDGKVYYWERSKTVAVFCLLLLPVWGFGLLLAIFLWSDLKHILVDQPKLAAMGGIGLRS